MRGDNKVEYKPKEIIELIFVREPTKLEKTRGGTPRQRGYASYPDKEGYEKAYFPYRNPAGYYYVRYAEQEA